MKIGLTIAASVIALASMGIGAAYAGTVDDGTFTVTATNSQEMTTFSGAKTFVDSNSLAGYTGSLVTSIATITGGLLNPGGSTNPDTGIDSSITNYLSTEPGTRETISFNANQRYFGTLWGSADVDNTVSLYEGNKLVASYTGATLEGNSAALQPYAAPGSFVSFLADSSSDQFNKIVFSGDVEPFETVNYAAAAVPEPATWALLLLGFLGIGFMVRGGRRKTHAVVA